MKVFFIKDKRQIYQIEADSGKCFPVIKSQCDGGCSNMEIVVDKKEAVKIIEVEYIRDYVTS